MSKKCYNCRQENDFDSNDDYLCKECKQANVIMRPVACHNLSDGPGSGVNELVFDKPDGKKSILQTAKKLEESGAFERNPEMRKYAEIKVKAAKNMPDQPKIDYSKTGYPGFDN